MNRRDFLKNSALAAAGAAAAASSGVAVVGYAADAAAGKLTVLNDHEAATILKMARQIFPHDQLADSAYQPTVEDLDAEAAKTPATAKILRDGVAQLDGAGAKQFVALSPDEQVAALKQIQDSPFFQKVHSTELVSLYNNHVVWKQFGYPGASYPFGGYIHHGFNDLNWLPDPPQSASPKPS
ncbi:MAG: twin-arginine translocation signal domain-containing protein [Candidatus Binataceae bacterium]